MPPELCEKEVKIRNWRAGKGSGVGETVVPATVFGTWATISVLETNALLFYNADS